MIFSVDTIVRDGVSCVVVTGEVDLATSPRFRREIRAAASSGRAVEVDLGGVDLIDSVGLGVLVGGARRARESGGSLRVTRCEDHVADLLRRSGLDLLLEPVR